MRRRRIPAGPLQLRAGGFSLLELMVALALGLLLSVGILSLFQGTSRTNKAQNGLARLQENGRFAITRMQNDLRMAGGQYCSNMAGGNSMGTVVPVLPGRAPRVFAPTLQVRDPQPGEGGAGLARLNSVVNGYASEDPASSNYPLSPRFFLQGYACSVDEADCAAKLPTDLPAAGLAAGARLPGSDVMTVRYQTGTGWPLYQPLPAEAPGVNCMRGGSTPIGKGDALADGDTLQVRVQTGDDDIATLTPGMMLISDCVDSAIIPVAAVSGSVLTIGTAPGTSSGILPGAFGSMCVPAGTRDARLFDFSNDFLTVTYYIGLRADENPDARPNSPAGRLIPVLIRRENGVDQEIVRGVDELRFRYGIQDATGATRFLTADEVDSNAGGTVSCPPPPASMTLEPGCLWRTVRVIEARLLVNTVDEVFGLEPSGREYRFDNEDFTTTDTSPLPSGLLAGSMPRREFIAYASNRNYNF
ncbi:MAG TPA: PilW family protein [Dokdonella sp.]